MSSNNIFPTMTGDISPEQMCGDINSNILVSADWYTQVPVCMILSNLIFNITSQLTPGISTPTSNLT